MAGEEDKGKNRGRKTTRALKKAVPSGEVSLDHFLDDTVEVGNTEEGEVYFKIGDAKMAVPRGSKLTIPGDSPIILGKDSEKKPKKRRAKAELEREWRIKTIEKEHKLDGKSMTINLKRCFITNLRVSQDVWEEVRARTIERLEQWSREAEERAQKKSRRTILMEDCI